MATQQKVSPTAFGKLTEELTTEQAYVLWAALCAMTQDNHAPQDMMTDKQWDEAESMYETLNVRVDREFG